MQTTDKTTTGIEVHDPDLLAHRQRAEDHTRLFADAHFRSGWIWKNDARDELAARNGKAAARCMAVARF